MSKIGKIPVQIPKEIKANISSTNIGLEGPKGKLSLRLPEGIKVENKDGQLIVTRTSNAKQDRANHGTTRARLVHMVEGLVKGHKKDLELQGIGYRATLKGKVVVFNVGLSHPVEFPVPDDVKVSVPSQTSIIVEGADKIRVGQIAASMRAIKPVEPYKGKGFRYVGEFVRRKQGKSVTK